MSNIERVGAMYAAFGRGDVPAILAGLAPDIEWDYGYNGAPIPWCSPRRGPAEVAGFFQSIASDLTIEQFDVKAILGEGNLVLALLDTTAVTKATGKRVAEPDEVHVWHFNDAGLVQKFRQRLDTWAAVEAMKP